jgi:hypothetical protein
MNRYSINIRIKDSVKSTVRLSKVAMGVQGRTAEGEDRRGEPTAVLGQADRMLDQASLKGPCVKGLAPSLWQYWQIIEPFRSVA